MSHSEIFFDVGDVALTIDCDVGTATPTAGTIILAGGTNINTAGAGNTVTINLDDFLDHGVLVGSGANPLTALAVGTNGQILIGSTAADPVFATVASADNSVAFTVGAGTLDLSITGQLTINTQVGTTYELVATDAGILVTCNNAAAITVTVPVNADVPMPIGTTVLISQIGAGVVTLAPEGGVTLSSRGGLLDTAGQYAVCLVVKIDTNVWLVSGDVS